MPIYRYRCGGCNKTKDEFRHIDSRNDAPECCSGRMERIIVAPMVQGDIDPYRSIAIDKETGKRPHIGSRKQHREFLLRNDYVEIGTQEFKPTTRASEPVSDITFEMGDL